MKEFNNFVPQELKSYLELIIENIDAMSESTSDKEVEFFKNEALRMIEGTKKEIENFASFQKCNYCN